MRRTSIGLYHGKKILQADRKLMHAADIQKLDLLTIRSLKEAACMGLIRAQYELAQVYKAKLRKIYCRKFIQNSEAYY